MFFFLLLGKQNKMKKTPQTKQRYILYYSQRASAVKRHHLKIKVWWVLFWTLTCQRMLMSRGRILHKFSVRQKTTANRYFFHILLCWVQGNPCSLSQFGTFHYFTDQSKSSSLISFRLFFFSPLPKKEYEL